MSRQDTYVACVSNARRLYRSFINDDNCAIDMNIDGDDDDDDDDDDALTTCVDDDDDDVNALVGDEALPANVCTVSALTVGIGIG